MNVFLYLVFGVISIYIFVDFLYAPLHEGFFKRRLFWYAIYILFSVWLFVATYHRNIDKEKLVVVHSEIEESPVGLFYKDFNGKFILIDKNSSFYHADKNKFLIKTRIRKSGWYLGIHFSQSIGYCKLVEKPKGL
jgi:hypothetical protein